MVGEERVDVVDEQDRVLRTVTRAEMRRDRLRHRAVFVAVCDGQGRILVHRRSPAKDVWPGWLDIAVGGVVASGETYDAAVERELMEEIGVSGVRCVPLDEGRAEAYDDDQVSLLGRCYVVTTTGPFVFRDGEVSEAWWVAVGDLDELFGRENFLPDSITLLLPKLHESPTLSR